ncbi:MAG TPA: hypothetical protein VGK17_21470 [Propionicimonas sp.]
MSSASQQVLALEPFDRSRGVGQVQRLDQKLRIHSCVKRAGNSDQPEQLKLRRLDLSRTDLLAEPADLAGQALFEALTLRTEVHELEKGSRRRPEAGPSLGEGQRRLGVPVSQRAVDGLRFLLGERHLQFLEQELALERGAPPILFADRHDHIDLRVS